MQQLFHHDNNYHLDASFSDNSLNYFNSFNKSLSSSNLKNQNKENKNQI